MAFRLFHCASINKIEPPQLRKIFAIYCAIVDKNEPPAQKIFKFISPKMAF